MARTDPGLNPSAAEAEPRVPAAPVASRVAIMAVGSGMFMQAVDSTALFTALPTLADAFQVSPVDLRLVLTLYMVVQALLLPASGWAADRFGARRVFMTAMIVFLLGSLISGFSQSLGQLVAGRIVQGMGGAMMVPVGRIIVVASSPRNQLVQAMMWLGLIALVGPIVGPAMSGLILSVANWPWIFFINLPVGLIALLAIARFVPIIARPHPGRFDWLGFGYAAIAIGAVMAVVEGMGHDPAIQIAGVLIAGPAVAAYLLHARRRQRAGRKPVLDLSLFRYHTFRSTILGSSLVRLGIGGSPYLLALLFQVGLGWSPLKSGIVMTAAAVGALSWRPFGPRMVKTLGFRRILIISSLAIGLSGAAPALFSSATPVWLIMAILFLTGYARSSQFSSANAMSYTDIPEDRISASSTLLAMMQQLTMSLGITIAGLVLQTSSYLRASPLGAADFAIAFTVIGMTSLLAIPIYRSLAHDAGAGISGQKLRADDE